MVRGVHCGGGGEVAGVQQVVRVRGLQVVRLDEFLGARRPVGRVVVVTSWNKKYSNHGIRRPRLDQYGIIRQGRIMPGINLSSIPYQDDSCST